MKKWIPFYAELNFNRYNKKAGEGIFSGFLLKDWRRPTLAEPIELLPSARQRLTAVFGMGTGRTTAVLPPKCLCHRELPSTGVRII
jgi:hypothetical protein